MTRFLLDTTALIDFSKRREPTRSRILSMIRAGDELGVCAINVAEFYTGVIPATERPALDQFIRSLAYWEITFGAAVRAGRYRYDFLRAGQTLSTSDVLVAAVARERYATLVTSNQKRYPMTDITLLSFVVTDS
jgi:predicted nucleic acid-binding protein